MYRFGIFGFLFMIYTTGYSQNNRLVAKVYPGYSLPSLMHNDARNVLDTVFYPVHGDECTLEIVTIGIQGWGRISGMNFFGDLEKAQRLQFDGSDNFTVVGALVFFEKPGIVGDGSVNCKVYSVDPTSGAPQAIKGFSNAVKMTEIMVPDSVPVPTYFSFEQGVDVNLSEPEFFVSVDFSKLYATRDTLVILQTIPECGDGGNTWELHNDGISWFPISSSFSWEINADFLINAVVDFNDPTSTSDYVSAGNLKIYPAYPNPVKSEVNLKFTINELSKVEVQVFDAAGSLIEEKSMGMMPQGDHELILNTSNYSNGTYLYRIKTTYASLVSRFEVAK
ncbi:MAG: T9SS type A sorting domain-containing protein [Saprospiraceae bacterium]|nr:T9SS type A sorting domain-containing protein [Saprospiraceae bacterium]